MWHLALASSEPPAITSEASTHRRAAGRFAVGGLARCYFFFLLVWKNNKYIDYIYGAKRTDQNCKGGCVVVPLQFGPNGTGNAPELCWVKILKKLGTVSRHCYCFQYFTLKFLHKPSHSENNAGAWDGFIGGTVEMIYMMVVTSFLPPAEGIGIRFCCRATVWITRVIFHILTSISRWLKTVFCYGRSIFGMGVIVARWVIFAF